jgi:methionyl-tRNA formyltransferase
MRVLLLANNWVGWQVCRWLREQNEKIVALAVHPAARAKYREEIIDNAGVGAEAIFDANTLRDPQVIGVVEKLAPDIAVSIFFGYILRPDILRIPPQGCINLHPALLPYNRGAHPNVWSIIDGTPAGATLHYLDRGVDTGDIIAQQPVEVEPIDTGETLYGRLEAACVKLFMETWPLIRAGNAPRLPQDPSGGTSHRVKDLERIDEIDLDGTYKAKQLIDLLRARTFAPYPGAYFRSRGRKVHLRLELAYEVD